MVLAFLLSLLGSFVVSELFANWGMLGSCFEGSCSYVAFYIVTPVLTLFSFLACKNWIKRWGPVSRTLGWTPIIIGVWMMMIGGEIFFYLIVSCIVVKILLDIKKQIVKGEPLRELFVRNLP